MDPSIRPNAMVALIHKLADEGKARRTLKRIEKPDMTTPWGVRALSLLDPRYDPKAYPDGCVWPLATGWTAVAEFRYRGAGNGYRYLKTMTSQLIREAGMYAELYRGDMEKPFNACVPQAWSAAMFINAFFSSLGVKRDALKKILEIRPNLPKEFKLVKVKRLRVGTLTSP